MITEHQEKFIKLMNKDLKKLTVNNTAQRELGNILINLATIHLKDILESFRDDIDILDDKIRDN
jgi:hypothetical protein